jgi:hypothetical protein
MANKDRGESWDHVRPDVAAWAQGFTLDGAVAAYAELRAFVPVFNAERAPETAFEREAVLKLHALDKRRYCLVAEARREKAKRRKEKQEATIEEGETTGSNGYPVGCVVATCEASGDQSDSIFGTGPRSVMAAMAQLTKRCSCGSGWHEES